MAVLDDFFNLRGENTLKKKLVIFVAVVITVPCLLLFYEAYGTNLQCLLSASHKVDANLLIIEGWLPDAAIETIKHVAQIEEYDLILTAGVRSPEYDFCMVAMNGYLIFYPDPLKLADEKKTNHIIEAVAKSKMGGIYRSHFNFFVNDSVIADFNADAKPNKYGINWFGSLSELDSVTVQFTNDTVAENGDRNLYVREIIIDNQIILPYQFNSVYDIGSIGGNNRIVNDYESHPQVIRNKLIADGMDSSEVVAITGKRTSINRTLVSALAVRKWIRATKPEITGINIVSMGVHSRRTWLTYRKVLGKSFSTGVISLPDEPTSENGDSKVTGILGEALDLVYYHIILLPYMFN
jgi:Ca-dependent carbohydrate-binding module xylan-binding